MDLHLKLDAGRDLSRQIYEQMRAAIRDGRLRRGDRLTPTRELAKRLDVSRNTVSLAYEWLAAEGLLSGQKGAGTFVENTVLSGAPAPSPARPIGHRKIWDAIPLPRQRDKVRFDFNVGVPDASLFPFDTWRRLLARQIRASKLDAAYHDPTGHPKFRESIARHIAVSRGVNASADNIIVTHGAQHAFDLVARVLIEAGDTIAVEDPGYPPPRLLFQSLGANVIGVPVDNEGLDVARLPDRTRLVYVTPSHQFPLGMPMSHARRVALLAWAERRNAVIIEDDYDSEFRFGGRPLETLQAIDRGGRVIYAGSFSKSLLPALRLGFLVAPPSLRDALAAASYVSGWHAQWPAQAALAALVDSGLLARHIRRARRAYAERHERILRKLTSDFADWLTPIPSVAGMHIAATLRSRIVRDEATIEELASEQGIAFDRLSVYYSHHRARAGIVLGYGAIATSDVDEGLRRLRKCFARCYQTARGTRHR